jgi:hypothetical protein
MNLTSCGNCGVVLDKNKLSFPCEDDLWNEDGSVNTEKAEWHDPLEAFVAAVPCPVCRELVPDA